MHSKIYQISNKPISLDNYLDPCYFYDEADRFGADYIGDSLNDEDRREYIESMAGSINDIFDFDGEALVYKGKDEMNAFVLNWYTYIRGIASNLDEKKVDTLELWKLQRAIEGTHLDKYSRIYIEDWNNCAGTFADFIEYVNHKLNKGDKLYFGAIIDFHI